MPTWSAKGVSCNWCVNARRYILSTSLQSDYPNVLRVTPLDTSVFLSSLSRLFVFPNRFYLHYIYFLNVLDYFLQTCKEPNAVVATTDISRSFSFTTNARSSILNLSDATFSARNLPARLLCWYNLRKRRAYQQSLPSDRKQTGEGGGVETEGAGTDRD